MSRCAAPPASNRSRPRFPRPSRGHPRRSSRRPPRRRRSRSHRRGHGPAARDEPARPVPGRDDERRSGGERMTVAVIGAGSWGTALAALAASVGDVTLWALEPEVVAGVNEQRENPLFHPGGALPERLVATGVLEAAVGGAEVVVMAVPTQHLRGMLERLA